MKPDHYRWQDFVIPPRRTLADLVATAVVIALSVGAIIASGPAAAPADPSLHIAASTASWPQAQPLATIAKPNTIPRIMANCL